MIRLYLVLAFIAIIGAAGWTGWNAYQNSQEALAESIRKQAQLELVLKTNQETQEKLKQFAENQRIYAKELNQELAAADAAVRELTALFAKSNITNLAEQKPSLIEKRINDATDKAFRDIECLTGNC